MKLMDRYGIRTSYFAKSGQLSNAVSIARNTPWWLKSIERYPDLAPPLELLRKAPYTYKAYYHAILKHLNPLKVAEDLSHKILCCWEKEPKHCHRRMVARWLKTNLGIVVVEVGKDNNHG